MGIPEEEVEKYLKEVAERASNMDTKSLKPSDALILSTWKYGSNGGPDYKIGYTNVKQLQMLRKNIEEAGDLYARDLGPSAYRWGNAEHAGGSLRSALSADRKNPINLNAEGGPEAFANEVGNAVRQGATNADIISELNILVTRWNTYGRNADSVFGNFDKFIKLLEENLATNPGPDGKAMPYILREDGSKEITHPQTVALISRMRRQNLPGVGFWSQNNQGRTYGRLTYGKTVEGDSQQDDRQMRELAAASIAISKSAKNYRVDGEGALSAAGIALKEARKSRIPFTAARILAGDNLDLKATRESIIANGSGYENHWHGLLPKKGTTAIGYVGYAASRLYGLAGGYYVPNAVKMMPDHWGANNRLFNAQLMKRGHAMKAAYVTGADVNPVTVGIAGTTAYSYVTGSSSVGPTQAAADAADADGNSEANDYLALSSSTEAKKIREWVRLNCGDPDLKLPSQWMPNWASDVDNYIESVVLRAAKLLKENPDEYPSWNAVSTTNDFEQVWTDAREQINKKLRENAIEESLLSAYKELTNSENDDLYNAKEDETVHFDRVYKWLKADEDGVAPISDDTLMVMHPWKENRASFIAEVKRREHSLSNEAENLRTAAIINAYTNGSASSATDLLKQAAELLAKEELNNDFLVPLKLDSNGQYVADPVNLTADKLQKALDDAQAELDRIEAERELKEREVAAAIGLNLWMKDNTPDNFAKIKDTALQDKFETDVVKAIAASGDTFSPAELRDPNVIGGIIGSTIKDDIAKFILENDVDGDGDVDAEDLEAKAKAAAANNSNGADDKDLGVTWSSALQSGENLISKLTDHDGDGTSALIDTDAGRFVSGVAQSAFGSVASGIGNLNATDSGKEFIGVGAGNLAALSFPSLAKRIPILKHIANIPVVGGLAIAFVSFFGIMKLTNSFLNGESTFGESDAQGDTGETGSTGDAQGDGKHIQRDVGFKVRVQGHDGKQLPEVIMLEVEDLDGDGQKDIINFFDTDNDGKWAAQVVYSDGAKSFAATELLIGDDKMQGLMNINSPDEVISKATLKSGATINLEGLKHTGGSQPSELKLTMGSQTYILNHELNDDGLMHDGDLEKMEPAT